MGLRHHGPRSVAAFGENKDNLQRFKLETESRKLLLGQTEEYPKVLADDQLQGEQTEGTHVR